MLGFHHDTQEEILPLFPELREDLGNYGGAARLLIKDAKLGRFWRQWPLNYLAGAAFGFSMSFR